MSAGRRLQHAFVCCALVAAVLSGCASGPTAGGSPRAAMDQTTAIRNQLVGTWEYEQDGAKVEIVYTPTTVSLPGVPPTPYVLEGNEITVDIVGAKTSIIEFRGKNEMWQTNKTDGQRYVFKRKRSS